MKLSGRLSHTLDAAAQFSSAIVGRGLFLLMQIYLARHLGPTEFGLYTVGWTLVGLAGAFCCGGMPQATLRFEVGGQVSLRSAPVVLATCGGLLAALMTAACADFLAQNVFRDGSAAPVIRAFSPAILFTSVLSVTAPALRVSGALGWSAFMNIVLFAASLALSFAAIHFGGGASAAALAYSVACAVTLLWSAAVLVRQTSSSHIGSLRSLLEFGAISMIIHGANVLNVSADRIILGILMEPSAVGLYQVASQMAMITFVLRGAIVTVFESSVPKLRHGEAIPNISRAFIVSTRAILHITAPGLIVLCLTAEFWVTTLFGVQYRAAANCLVILVLGQLLLSVTGPSVNALHMTGGEKMALVATLLGAVLNLAGNLLLVRWLGIYGAALTSVLSNGMLSILCLAQLRRTGRLNFPIARLTDIAAASTSAACTCFAVLYVADVETLLSVGVAILLTYAVYAGMMIVLSRPDDEAILVFVKHFPVLAKVRRVLARNVDPPTVVQHSDRAM